MNIRNIIAGIVMAGLMCSTVPAMAKTTNNPTRTRTHKTSVHKKTKKKISKLSSLSTNKGVKIAKAKSKKTTRHKKRSKLNAPAVSLVSQASKTVKKTGGAKKAGMVKTKKHKTSKKSRRKSKTVKTQSTATNAGANPVQIYTIPLDNISWPGLLQGQAMVEPAQLNDGDGEQPDDNTNMPADSGYTNGSTLYAESASAAQPTDCSG